MTPFQHLSVPPVVADLYSAEVCNCKSLIPTQYPSMAVREKLVLDELLVLFSFRNSFSI